MKKFISSILSFVLLISITAVLDFSAVAEMRTDFEYNLLDDGTAEISKYNGSLTEVAIPDTIDGYKVTAIGKNAFFCRSDITDVTLPFGITKIGPKAFYLCRNIASINFPDSIRDIDLNAFYGCQSLSNISLPGGVEHIGFKAFRNTGAYYDESCWENEVLYIGNYLVDAKNTLSGNYVIKASTRVLSDNLFSDCAALQDVFIPASVIKIGSDAFHADCRIVLDENNSNYTVEDYVLFNKDKTRLIRYFNSCAAEYTIPDSVLDIASYAFCDCTNLTSITIHGNINAIHEYSFYNCSNLVSVSLAEGLKSVGNAAFYSCKLLKNIVIPSSVEYLGENVFQYCESLTDISIPEGVSAIEKSSFMNCTNLTNVTLPDSIRIIGTYAFSFCNSLEKIDIPYGVTKIGYGAFSYCKSLKSIVLPDSILCIEDMAIKSCPLISELVIPEGVKTIGKEAFSDNKAMKTVILSASVESIAYAAFKSESIQSVYFIGTQEQWNSINIDNKDHHNQYLLDADIHFMPQSYCITVDKAKYGTVSINGSNATQGITAVFSKGERITLKAEPVDGARFVGWVANGITTVSTDAQYTVSALANVTYTPIFEFENNRCFTVIFADAYGNVLDLQVVTSGEEIEIPAAPQRVGFNHSTANGWSLSNDEILSVCSCTLIYACYSENTSALHTITAKDCLIKVSGESFYDKAVGIPYDAAVTVCSDKAKAWEINGFTVAYGSAYSFYVGSDIDVKPVYDTLRKVPVVAAVSVSCTETDLVRASFLATRSMAENFTYVNSGYIYGAGDLGCITLNDVNGSRVKAVYNKTDSDQFSLTFGLKSQSGTMTARAFLVYVDAAGEVNVTYAKPQTYTY